MYLHIRRVRVFGDSLSEVYSKTCNRLQERSNTAVVDGRDGRWWIIKNEQMLAMLVITILKNPQWQKVWEKAGHSEKVVTHGRKQACSFREVYLQWEGNQ